ncbi:hypothetical protein RF11_12160 [Thelohanellus kitauei]|uniref:Uncharacterized protein n=1 Tax=Thelohanellus kitauei TaxID=669202 RepID=A0A0C2M7H7_THEKT|nr:hypothetical protein RF11_12160 [Thelohanellus kitauei]
MASQGGSKLFELDTLKDLGEAMRSKSQGVHKRVVHEGFFDRKVQGERLRDYVTALESFSPKNSLNVHHVRSDDDFTKTYQQASRDISTTFTGMVIVAVFLKIVGILIVVGIIGFVVWFLLVRRRSQAQQNQVLPRTPDEECLLPARV